MPSDVHLSFKSQAGRNLARNHGDDHSVVQQDTSVRTSGEVEEDSQEDAAAPGGNAAFGMNQSIFQLITVAGSKASFNRRYESSDSEDGDHDDDNGVPHNVLRSIAILNKAPNRRHCGRRMLKSTPHLPRLGTRLESHTEQDGGCTDDEETRTIGPPSPNRIPVSEETSAPQPHLLSAALSASMAKNEAEGITYDEDDKKSDDDLATKLMEIFGFSEPEDVISGTLISRWLEASF